MTEDPARESVDRYATLDKYRTLEPLPDSAIYRGRYGRPTLKTLVGVKPALSESLVERSRAEPVAEETSDVTPVRQFGTAVVIVRTILGIMGVIALTRLGYVVGHCGLWQATIVGVTGFAVTFLTSLSLGAISSNGDVAGGGAYYLISRSLGADWGGAIGVVFYVSNAIGATMHTFGFAETLASLLGYESIWAQRFIAMITILVLLIIALVGIAWVQRVQFILLGILALAVLAYIIGAVFPIYEITGLTHLSFTNLKSNLPSAYGSSSFAAMFSLYFPAASGLLAGSNISGELKDPQKSIGFGTMVSVIIANSTYIVLIWVLGITTTRDALKANYLIMADAAVWPPLVYAGVFSATLSSAIASIDGAPRVLQALAADNVLTPLNFLGKLSSSGEPVRAYILTFIIAEIACVLGDLNVIAPIISNFFLICYALINYSCFAMSRTDSPHWRPSWKAFSPWVSLVTAILCLSSMFYMNWVLSFVSLMVFFIIFIFIRQNAPQVSWGTCNDSALYVDALLGVLRLTAMKPHIKTYRPQFLIFTSIEKRPDIVAFVGMFWQAKGLTIIADVIKPIEDEPEEVTMIRVAQLREDGNEALIRDGIKAFYDVTASTSLLEGVKQHIQLCGVGALRPNVAVFGHRRFRRYLPSEEPDPLVFERDEIYVRSIRSALLSNQAIMVCGRVSLFFPGTEPRQSISRGHAQSIAGVAPFLDDEDPPIDVWFLSDDGGLTLLLAYILQQSPLFSATKLRIFSCSMTEDDGEIQEQVTKMTKMLDAFRIEAAEITAVSLLSRPSMESVERFNNLHAPESDSKIRETQRMIRLAEMVKRYSAHSAVAFITMPVPAIDTPSRLYLAWLDFVVSDSTCPVVFLRGTDEQVLTFET